MYVLASKWVSSHSADHVLQENVLQGTWYDTGSQYYVYSSTSLISFKPPISTLHTTVHKGKQLERYAYKKLYKSTPIAVGKLYVVLLQTCYALWW